MDFVDTYRLDEDNGCDDAYRADGEPRFKRRYAPELPACMGGMCSHRDHCRRHLAERRAFVVERLCARGHEVPEPVFVVPFSESEIAREEPHGTAQ